MKLRIGAKKMSSMKEQTYIKTKAPMQLYDDAIFDDRDEPFARKQARKEAKDNRQRERQKARKNKSSRFSFEGE